MTDGSGRVESFFSFFVSFFLFIFLACLTWSLLCDMPGLGMLQDCFLPSWGEYMFLCSNCAGFWAVCYTRVLWLWLWVGISGR